MGEHTKALAIHMQTLDPPMPSTEGSVVESLASELDAENARLAAEPDSLGRERGIREAHRHAEESAVRLLDVGRRRLQPGIDAAYRRWTEPPEITEPWRTRAIWDQLPAGMTQLEYSAVWGNLSPEMKDALLVAPPRVRKTAGGGLIVEDLVDPRIRESEMRARRPAEAERYDQLFAALQRVELVVNGFIQRVKKSKTSVGALGRPTPV